MAKRHAKRGHKRMQGDFFEERLFPVRQQALAGPRASDLSLRIKTAMGEALSRAAGRFLSRVGRHV